MYCTQCRLEIQTGAQSAKCEYTLSRSSVGNGNIVFIQVGQRGT